MKMILHFSFPLIFTSIISIQQLLSQPENFDIIAYRPPKSWQKVSKQSFISYTTINQKTGGFCLLALYSATNSTGSAEKDFEKEWNDLVVKPYNAINNPKPETQTNDDGWKVTAGAAQVQKDGIRNL